MIKVIAIEPEVMGNPAFLREYLKDFGTARGRWIPLVPHNWKATVSGLLKKNHELRPVAKNALRDKIVRSPRHRDRFVSFPKNLTFPDQWIEAVKPLCKEGVIDCAMVRDDPGEGEMFLVAGQFDPDEEPYSSRISQFLVRDPKGLVGPIRPILRFSREFHIIDNFLVSSGSSKGAYRSFIEEIFKYCRKVNSPIKVLHFYRSRPANLNLGRERANYSEWICPILNFGESVVIHYLKETKGERVHIRAVFSDLALASGHYGFGKGNTSLETTDFVLRELDDLEKIRKDYLDSENGAFEQNLAEVIRITSEEGHSERE